MGTAPIVLTFVLLAVTCLAGDAAAQLTGADARAVRRTPAVEVYEQWKDSVVFVTGPRVKGDKPTTEEFFLPTNPGPQEMNVGTGFVIHESGYIVTNAHSAERLIESRIVLDGKSYPAELIGVGHGNDIALLKIEAGRSLKPVRLAMSNDVMVGETVIVIANPHGLMRTCTVGVVSAISRAAALADFKGLTLQNLLQSDAAINPGSSGGPWFNAVGEVMGMTTSMKRDAENIAFAVPVAAIRKNIPEMLDVERRQGLTTGITVSPDGPCTIAAIRPDSPGAAAGLQVGDVIQQLGDQATPTGADYHLALIGRKPGESIAIHVEREGRKKRGSIALGQRSRPDAAALLRQKLGMTAAPLTPEQARAMRMRIPRGVLITEVDPKVYPKDRPHPQPGDVLARIGYIRPRDLDQVGQLLENASAGQQLSVVLLRLEENRPMRIDMSLMLSR